MKHRKRDRLRELVELGLRTTLEERRPVSGMVLLLAAPAAAFLTTKGRPRRNEAARSRFVYTMS